MKKLTILVFSGLVTMGCQASDDNIDSLIQSSEQLLQAEDSKSIYLQTMNFEEYFEQFQQALNSKDKALLTKLSDIDFQSTLSINELTEEFDTYIYPELVSDLMQTKAKDLQDTTLPNGQPVKVYNFYEEMVIEGETLESSTLFYFQNTENGWKLIRVMIAG